jgi:exodeoxyribonuclease VII small subunit
MSDKNDSSFEDKLKELEALIEQIESGKDGLNSSVEKYAQAQDLAAQLEKILKGAKEAVELEEEQEDNEEEE